MQAEFQNSGKQREGQCQKRENRIFVRSQFARVERYKKDAERTIDKAANAVNKGMLESIFYLIVKRDSLSSFRSYRMRITLSHFFVRKSAPERQ